MSVTEMTYDERIEILRTVKREHGGPRDADEQGMVLLPSESAEMVEAMSGSGVMVRDFVLKGFEIEPNHPSKKRNVMRNISFQYIMCAVCSKQE